MTSLPPDTAIASRLWPRLQPPNADFRLPAELIDYLSRLGKRHQFPRNTLIERAGEPPRCFYVLLSGRVHNYASDGGGKEIHLNTIFPGESFGEIVVADGSRVSSVRTALDSELICIEKQQFERAVAERPDFALLVLRRVSSQQRELINRVASLALTDVYGRVVRLLMDLAEERDGARLIPHGLSQQDIANRVGASRSMINRIMRDLTRGGYLESGRDGIVIRKPPPPNW